MKGVLQAIGLLLLAGGILYWASGTFRSAPPAAQTQVASPLPALDEEGRMVLTGVTIYQDTAEGDVPYIEYRTPSGELRTKQLLFENSRGCSPSAGDLPCISGSSQTGPEPPYGTRIRVTGIIEGDQILVEHIERLS